MTHWFEEVSVVQTEFTLQNELSGMFFHANSEGASKSRCQFLDFFHSISEGAGCSRSSCRRQICYDRMPVEKILLLLLPSLTRQIMLNVCVSGAERARSIANTFGNSLQWWTGVGTMSWDYVTNYFFSQSASRGIGVSQAMGHLSDLSSIVQELTQLGSDNERLQWLARNYSRAFAVAKSALGNLLSIFDTDVSF